MDARGNNRRKPAVSFPKNLGVQTQGTAAVAAKTVLGGEAEISLADHIAKDATVDSEHGVVKGTEYTAKEGEKVTVHYTEEAGKKVAHFIKRL